MIRFNRNTAVRVFVCVVGVAGVLTVTAMAQYGGGTGAAGAYVFNKNYHIGFERPEAWGLKYFASVSLLSGLQPPDPPEGRRAGSVTVGVELGWLPTLDAGQTRIGFNGKAPQELNKAPILVR